MVVNFMKALLFKLYLNLIGALYVVKEQVLDRHRQPRISGDHTGKTIVITGGSKGIGLEAVKTLLKLGCKIIIGCRSVDLAKAELRDVSSEENCHILYLDLMSLKSVKTFASQVKNLNLPIDVLVNNAGIMFGSRKETTDGHESQFATNYLGHFLLSHLLLEDLKRGKSVEEPGRIINVSSCAHFLGSWMDLDDLDQVHFYSPESAYGNSKAAQVMFSQFLDSLLSEEGRLRVISLHPGVVYTDLYTDVWWVQIFTFVAKMLMKSASQGGDTIVHAVLAADLSSADTKGKYLENSKLCRISGFTASLENQTKLWKNTCQMLNVDNFGQLD